MTMSFVPLSFIGYVFEPIVYPLWWGPIVRDYVCDLFMFISLSDTLNPLQAM
jgi:hypothetical protein